MQSILAMKQDLREQNLEKMENLHAEAVNKTQALQERFIKILDTVELYKETIKKYEEAEKKATNNNYTTQY